MTSTWLIFTLINYLCEFDSIQLVIHLLILSAVDVWLLFPSSVLHRSNVEIIISIYNSSLKLFLEHLGKKKYYNKLTKYVTSCCKIVNVKKKRNKLLFRFSWTESIYCTCTQYVKIFLQKLPRKQSGGNQILFIFFWVYESKNENLCRIYTLM